MAKYTKKQVAALFSRMVMNGVFDDGSDSNRNYDIAKKLLKSHLDIDYENIPYESYDEEIRAIIQKEEELENS